jgi:RNA polymerase-binding transcription factor DksA
MPNKKKTPVKKKSATKKLPIKKVSTRKTSASKAKPKKKAVKKAMTAKKVTKKKVAVKKTSASKAKPKKKAVKKATTTKKKVVRKKVSSKKPTIKEIINTTETSEVKATLNDDSSLLKESVISRTETIEYKKPAPIALSIDEIEEMMAAKKPEEAAEESDKPKSVVHKQKKTLVIKKADKKRVLGAASLSDILGFNPNQKKRDAKIKESEIPKKWIKYYRLLMELRSHVSDELSLHTSETLGHSSREDSGDLSNFVSHQADAGTDTFDRDFALSLVSSEHDALNEIEEAILRIKDGSFGICEVTNKRIPAARLAAVPFTRFSVEGQSEHEKNSGQKSRRSDTPSIFGDVSDAPKLVSSDDDDS